MQRTNRKRNKRQKRKPKPVSRMTALERPFKPSRELEIVTRTQAIVLNPLTDFVVFEGRLMSLANQVMSGGTSTVTTSTIGLADATAYARGRAKSFKLLVSGVSLEPANTLAVGFIFSDTQPSTVITTRTLAVAAATGYIHTPIQELGIASGMGKFRTKPLIISARTIISDPSVADDNDFTCTLNPAAANSVQEVWIAAILTSQATGTLIAAGVSITIELTTKFRAYSRLPAT